MTQRPTSTSEHATPGEALDRARAAWAGEPETAGDAAEVAAGQYRPGNAADFHRLYDASFARVRAMLMAVLRDPSEAEDCTQEAFVRAYWSWARWRPEAPAEAWVHRIALNVALSRRRRQRFAVLLHDRLGARDDHGLDGVAERNDLLAALRTLPPRQAAALVLRHLHGYSNREIAAALGVPERTVASRLAAARNRLRRQLGWASAGETNGYIAPFGRSPL